MMRQAQHYNKKLPNSCNMDPWVLVESFSRTRWLDKPRPAGASQKADGPEGPMAPIVTNGVLIVEKKNFLTRHPCAGCHVNLSVSFYGRSTNCACHPDARTMQFSPYYKGGQETSGTRSALRPASSITSSNCACHP